MSQGAAIGGFTAGMDMSITTIFDIHTNGVYVKNGDKVL